MIDFLSGSSEEVAPRLLGWRLVRELNGKNISGMVVETEAYSQIDAASHSYKGVTPRTEVMFGHAGHAYVYFTYGMHYCMNIVTGEEGEGSAVLIRAVEPIDGVDTMKKLRGTDDITNLTNGPAKLCQAFSIDRTFNGHKLTHKPLYLLPPESKTPKFSIQAATRIGITKDTDRLWRFYIAGSRFISRV